MEDMCHGDWGVVGGWEVVQKLTAGLVAHSLFLVHVNTDVKLSASSPAPCLPICHHASYHDDNGLKV